MMHDPQYSRRLILTGSAALLLGGLAAGCGNAICCPRGLRSGQPRGIAAHRKPPLPLGSEYDKFWKVQGENVDASNFVLYQHEFTLNGIRLNGDGEDHLKRIAQRMIEGANYPVIIERSNTSSDPKTKYQFPIHRNPDLDNRRREVVIKALTALAVPDPENRVIVALPYSQGLTPAQADQIGSGRGGGGGSFRGGFGGFGGGGGGGGGVF